MAEPERMYPLDDREPAKTVATKAIVDVDPEAAARLISGAPLYAAQWIANSPEPEATSKRAVKAFNALLEGLRVESGGRVGT